jgi:hypothetical protein
MQRVMAEVADESVIAFTRPDHIIAFVAIKAVVAFLRIDLIVAGPAGNGITRPAAGQKVIGGTTRQRDGRIFGIGDVIGKGAAVGRLP